MDRILDFISWVIIMVCGVSMAVIMSCVAVLSVIRLIELL